MRVIDGFEWPDEDTGMAMVAFSTLPNLDKALSYVSDFSICVQAGGNVGVWPKHLSEHFGYVYTFEPSLINFQYLCRNVPRETVYKFPCGLGNGGIGTLIENKENIGAGQMAEGGFTPILKIDDLCLPACGFIQLDIEGMELKALEGAVKTIKEFHPVLMIEQCGHGPKVDDFLKDHGYKVITQAQNDMICK